MNFSIFGQISKIGHHFAQKKKIGNEFFRRIGQFFKNLSISIDFFVLIDHFNDRFFFKFLLNGHFLKIIWVIFLKNKSKIWKEKQLNSSVHFLKVMNFFQLFGWKIWPKIRHFLKKNFKWGHDEIIFSTEEETLPISWFRYEN